MSPEQKARTEVQKQSLDLLNFMQDKGMMYIFNDGDDKRPYFGETSETD